VVTAAIVAATAAAMAVTAAATAASTAGRCDDKPCVADSSKNTSINTDL
jgi:hypothetical protein